jgi:hypothetical protein
MVHGVAYELDRSEKSSNFHDEHDGVLDHRARMQFPERINDGGLQDLRVG